MLQPRLKELIKHKNNFFNLSQIKTVKSYQIFILKVKQIALFGFQLESIDSIVQSEKCPSGIKKLIVVVEAVLSARDVNR